MDEYLKMYMVVLLITIYVLKYTNINNENAR